MEEVRKQLYEAIEFYGMTDIITVMLSQKLDRMIVEAQRKRVQ